MGARNRFDAGAVERSVQSDFRVAAQCTDPVRPTQIAAGLRSTIWNSGDVYMIFNGTRKLRLTASLAEGSNRPRLRQ